MTLRPRPTVPPASLWAFPEPLISTLDGLTVYFYPLLGQHVINATLVMDLPLEAEEGFIEGIADLTARCAIEATGSSDALSFARRMDAQGAVIDAHATRTSTMIDLTAPSSRIGQAAHLIAEAIANPRFDQRDICRQRDLRLAEFEADQIHPSAIADLAFHQALFSSDSRYGRPLRGSSDTVATIDKQMIESFYRTRWHLRNASLIIAGDLDLNIDELSRIIPTSLSAEPVHIDPVPIPREPVIWLIDRPDAVQAEIRIGCITPTRHDPRWAALNVAAWAVGGSFASRLNTLLREEKGYTYGAHARFQSRKHSATFSAQTSCRTEVTGEVIAHMLNILDIGDCPLSHEEVANARSYLVGIAPLVFQTSERICDQAAIFAANGIDSRWFNDHNRRLSAVSCDEATEAFRHIVIPDQQTIVICGDAHSILPQLDRCGYHPQIIDFDL